MRNISVISLFPDFVEAYFAVGMMAKARHGGVIGLQAVDLREFGLGPRRQVDDTPCGGGGGMILKIEPLVAAIEALKRSAASGAEVILVSPRGRLFKQAHARELADSKRDLILVGGRYEGYDERLVNWVDRQFAVGQYVLTGSELPALTIVDSVVRLLDGVLGNPQGVLEESFSDDPQVIEYPQYTKPDKFRDFAVPDVLLSGNHGEIAAWRKRQSGKFKL